MGVVVRSVSWCGPMAAGARCRFTSVLAAPGPVQYLAGHVDHCLGHGGVAMPGEAHQRRAHFRVGQAGHVDRREAQRFDVRFHNARLCQPWLA